MRKPLFLRWSFLESWKAILKILAMLVRGMFGEPGEFSQHFWHGGSSQHHSATYAGARVVFKKVALQTMHWMSIAFWLTFNCDLATLVSSPLRSRFEAALAP